MQLAEGFLSEAQQDVGLERWRSCVDNSQLAIENATKAALTLLGPVARTHDPGELLARALEEARFPPAVQGQVRRLAELGGQLGWEVHMASDYGDETGRRTPWELFDEGQARQAVSAAQEAVALAREVVDLGLRNPMVGY